MTARSIQVSDATYAELWKNWEEGDQDEEGVLQRLLGMKSAKKGSKGSSKVGYHDRRFDVTFKDGFKIYRNYKGIDYWAVAENDGWTFGNERFPATRDRADSLNELSNKIGANENAWIGWFYRDGNLERPISDLRSKDKVHRRRVL